MAQLKKTHGFFPKSSSPPSRPAVCTWVPDTCSKGKANPPPKEVADKLIEEEQKSTMVVSSLGVRGMK